MSSMQIFGIDDLKFKAPFCCVIGGQSGSGKTTLLVLILKNVKMLINPPPKSILYCYGQYNSSIPSLQQQMGIRVNAGMPSEEMLQSGGKPMLLLLDDLMLNAKREQLATLFTKQSHHQNISTIFIVQNLFEKNLKLIRDNSQYIILLNSPSAALQIRSLGQQLFPGNLKYFLSAYKQAVSDKRFGYLLIDLHPASNSQLRLRTNIIPDNKVEKEEELEKQEAIKTTRLPTIFLPE